jgi:Leucine-rich repeat (LRR) protein
VRLWNVALPQPTINRYKGVELTSVHPQWGSLLGYWKLNEYSGGVASDASGNGNAGTVVGSPLRVVSGAPLSLIANPVIGVGTGVRLPSMPEMPPLAATGFSVVTPALRGVVTPVPGNPVVYTPTMVIGSGVGDSFVYQVSDGVTVASSAVSVGFEPRLTGGVQTVVPATPTALVVPDLSGGTPPYTWSWSPSVGLSATTVALPVVTTTVARTYTVTVQDALGFSHSAMVTVNVAANPMFVQPPTEPLQQAVSAERDGGITLRFADVLLSGTASVGATVQKVWGSMTGLRSATYSASGASLSTQPVQAFRAGEEVWLTVTNAQNTAMTATRPFTMSFRARAGVGPGLFQQVQDVGVRALPTALASADLDNNGTVDVLVAHAGSAEVLPLLNSGTGSLSAGVPVVLSSLSSALGTGDLDNDGDVDAVVVSASAMSMAVLVNNGAGVLTLGGVVVLPERATAVAVGDYDADGFLDVVIGLSSGEAVMARNNGAGGFVVGAVVALPSGNPSHAVAADFDNDGDTDVVISGLSSSPTNVSLLINNGLGVFAVEPLTVGSVPQRVAAGDMFGSGRADIVSVNSVSGTLTVLRNMGGLAFTTSTVSVCSEPTGVVLADVDGDRDMDMVVSCSMSGEVVVVRNDGGRFVVVRQPAGQEAAVGRLLPDGVLLRGSPRDVVSGDFDGDGDLDLATVNYTGNGVAVLRNQQLPQMSAVPNPVSFGVVDVGQTVELPVQINGSNLVDVVSVRASGDFGAMGFSLSSTPTLTFSTRASVVIGTTATAPASVAAQVYVRFSASSTAASFSTLAVLTRGGVGIVLPVIANAIVPPPTITTFSPSRAAGDATVLVTGTQYQWATRVLVGTTVASFSILSPTQIALVVPRSGFSSAPITVISPGGSATSVMPLVFIPLPEISHISTTIATVGTPIVISGSGLSNPSGVSIGGVPVLEFRVLNDGMIELIAPEAATTGTITIVGEGGVQSSAREITITPPPAIRVPMTTVVGSTGGTIILTGTNFTFVTGASIGGTTTTVRVLSPTQIAIIVPAGLSTTTETQRVELLAQGNGFSRAEIPFAYSSVPPPVITMLTTPTASTGGTVRLVGEHLAGATVFVGGVRAVVVQNTDGSVSFVMPSGLPPSTMGYAITVRTQGGEAASPRNIFPPPVAVPAPLITGLSPRVMEAGGVVVVSGGNFANVQNVFIGGFPVRYQIVSSTQIVITVPEALVVPTNVSINTGLSGRVTVVTSSGVGTSADVLNQPLPPVITAVGPSSGSPGDTVVLSGEHFRGLQAITFGGLPVQSWQQTSPTRVVVVLSSMATRMTNAPIVAVGPGGSTTASVQFRFSVSLERDSLALRALYEATGGVFWRERRGWSAADVPVEQWHGVTVEQNRIVRLVLPSNALRDTLPSALGALSGLRELDLSDNNLTGVLPDSLRLLGKLEVVRLARNRFRGGVGVMCSWPNARILDFSRNELGGPIPRCIGLLTAMEYFDVSQNAFVEDIPVEMVNLSRLEVMLLGQNQLSGGLPAEFGLDTVVSVRSDAPRGMSGKHSTARVQTLGALRVMDVSNNQLTGTLPATLGNITSLRSLVLQNNRFTGVVPVEFAQLRNLRRLELSRNRLTLVPDLRGIPRLDTLRLEHNRLDFASIEPNLGVGEFFYAPQDTLGVGVDTTVMLGSTVRLARFAGGAANEYQWYKARWSVNAGGMSSGVSGSSASSGLVWVPVAVGNRSVLALEAFSLSDTGTYECRITNTEARALTLYTRPITLRARSEAAPAQPELRLPINTAVYVPPRPRFVWRRQPEASSYVVQVSSEPSFTTLITSATIGATMGAVFGTTADAVSDSVRWRMPSGGRLLERNRRYWWRVQARNEHGASAWSAVWSFTTAPEGVDVVLSSVEFGRLPVGDTARARGGGRISGELVNISGKALTVRSIAALDAAQFQTQDDLRSLVLLDDEVEFPVVLWFTPRRVGRQVSGVAIDYSVGTTQQAVAAGQSLPDKTGKTEKTAPTLQTTPQTALLGDSVLRGTGTALKALTVNFGVVRSTRRTLTAGLLINRGQQEVTVRQVRVRNDGLLHGTLNGAFTGAFTGTAGGVVSTSGTSIGGNATIPFRAEQLEAAGEPMILGAGDTSAVILWCAPPQDGLWEGAVEYIADGDTARASILALARAPRAEDVTLTPFVVAARSSAVAGDTVPVGIGFEESRSAQARARLFTAVIPRVRVMVSFSKAVLALPANEVRAVAMRTSSPRTRTTILATAPVLWNGRDTTLVDFHTLAVLGDTERTTLKLLSVEWGTLSEGSGVLTAGTLGNQSAMQPAARTIQVGGLSFVEKAVFVELPENPHAEVALAACVDSLTGTVRLLHGTRTTTLAHSPNPASDALKVLYTLRESGIITLTLIDMHGRTVKTLASGYHQAGVYELSLPTDDLPSAVYTLRLITQTEHRASTLRLMR